MRSLQQIFDTSASHLLRQGKKCHGVAIRVDDRTSVTVCKYHCDGLKDAIGCLIPDSAYTPELEGLPVLDDQVLRVLASVGIPVQHKPCRMLLARLQYIHDTVEPHRWKSKLKKTALDFKLKPLRPRG